MKKTNRTKPNIDTLLTNLHEKLINDQPLLHKTSHPLRASTDDCKTLQPTAIIAVSVDFVTLNSRLFLFSDKLLGDIPVYLFVVG